MIVVYSETDAARIGQNLGKSEYSYHFILKAYYPVLEQIDRVIMVTDPSREVDPIYRRAIQSGEECIFLSFSPPHRMPQDLACPTIPVIAWEYNTIPNETWCGQPQQDWRFVLNKLGRAITLSSFSADAVRSALGTDFPVVSIPAPVFDRFKSLRERWTTRTQPSLQRLMVSGRIIDTRAIDLPTYRLQYRHLGAAILAHNGTETSQPISLELDGVIYLTVLNPEDYRKNYLDLLCGFCWAFREVDDATLVIKLSHHDAEAAIGTMLENLFQLSPFKCRVVLIEGYLGDEEYGKLLSAAMYGVNTSQGEGQCLPLMESLALGKPAVSPSHTAMIDYLSPKNAFLVASTIEPAAWPQDPRAAYRAFSYRIDFESLLNELTESYHVAREQPGRYRQMGEAAKETLEQCNSDAVTLERLRSFLALTPRPPAPSDTYGKIPPSHYTYLLGDVIDFASAFDARRYLGPGWGAPELGFGVWSNGPVAELYFRLQQRPAVPLRLRINLTAFVVREHPAIMVQVTTENVEIAQWSFNVAQPELIHGSWREATIPLEVTEKRAFSIKLRINEPASPKKLGLSGDIRLLGILLHRLSISPEAGIPPKLATS